MLIHSHEGAGSRLYNIVTGHPGQGSHEELPP